MLSLKRQLKKSLKEAKRAVVLGIGSSLRRDDALGLSVIKELRSSLKKQKKCMPLKLFSCATAPENYTSQIKRFKPDLIIIIDAVDMAKEAGTVAIIDTKSAGYNVSFSTHRMPLSILIDYLIKSLDCRVVTIGIQPESVAFGASDHPATSDKVDKAVKELSSTLALMMCIP